MDVNDITEAEDLQWLSRVYISLGTQTATKHDKEA